MKADEQGGEMASKSSNSSWFTLIFDHFSVVYKVGIILFIYGARCLVEAVADGGSSSLVGDAVSKFNGMSTLTVALLATLLVLVVTYFALKAYNLEAQPKNAPPLIPSHVPFLGSAIEFNKNPVDFLLKMKEKYGPVFTFEMVGKKFTYLVGNEASALLFNSKNEDLNAEDVYQKLVTPVFGKGVAYDVPNDIFLEQKKMFKGGLNIARFKEYVPVIEKEARDYLDRHWTENSGEVDIFEAFSEMIILTASHCLHGPEIRAVLTEHVANLYNDLDKGFCPEAWLLPAWMHCVIPKLRRRDAAHREMKQIFYKAIDERRKSGQTHEDMLQTLLDTPYKNGRHMTDDEIAGMLIGLLMAGQHTSSSTSTWMAMFLSKNPDMQQQIYEEQVKIRSSHFDPVDYDQLKDMKLLDNSFKETLRLQPPIYTIIRQSRKPLEVCGYTIPAGHSVAVSPHANHRLDAVWGNSWQNWHPERFDETTVLSDNKFCYVPFGAGRHRCIGESFAYVQNKVIWSVVMERFELELIGEFPEPDYMSMIPTPVKTHVLYKRRENQA